MPTDVCSIMMYKKNLKTHMERKHGTRKIAHQHSGICIDRNLVMFLVAENISGAQYPVHVQKLIGGNCPPKIICESKRCVADKLVNGMSGNPTFVYA